MLKSFQNNFILHVTTALEVLHWLFAELMLKQTVVVLNHAAAVVDLKSTFLT